MTRVLSSSSLCGTKVKNTRGENLGDITDLMVDLNTGEISYAVLSFGGILGMGDKLFAVPWGAMTLDTEEEIFVLDADKAYLEQAPGFPKNDWPDFASPEFREKHYSYYQTKMASR